MADAKKCDRCPLYYTQSKGVNPNDFNGLQTIQQESTIKTVKKYDLCPKCATSFTTVFMKDAGK